MTLLTEGAGAGGNAGSGGNGSGGGASDGGGSGGGSGAAGGGAGAGAAAGGGQATWRDSLPEDIRGDVNITKFSDVGTLAKSYVELQKVVGKKGIFPPGDKATPEQWKDFYKAAGQPEYEKFEVKIPEGKKADSTAVEAFRKLAHDNGLMPKQAQGVMEWLFQQEEASSGAKMKAVETQAAEQLGGLKKEWGDGYDKQIALARMAVKDVGGEDFQKHLDSTGLGNDVQVIRMMAKVGALLGEDKLRGDGAGGKFGQTPAEIQGEIDKVMGDTKNPYFDRNHAGHAAAVKHMEGLYKKLHGTS